MTELTKKQARAIINRVLTYFCKLVQFERMSDIYINIVDTPHIEEDSGNGTEVVTLDGYRAFALTINLNTYNTEQKLIEAVIHELCHIFAGELNVFPSLNFNDEDWDELTTKRYGQALERVAMRFEAILTELWNKNCKHLHHIADVSKTIKKGD